VCEFYNLYRKRRHIDAFEQEAANNIELKTHDWKHDSTP